MKPGIKTTEFWLTLIGSLVPFLAWVTEYITAQWAVSAATFLIAAYNLSRGLSKKTN